MFLFRLILPETGEMIEMIAKNMTSVFNKSFSLLTDGTLEPDEITYAYMNMIYIDRQGVKNWKAGNYDLIPDYHLMKGIHHNVDR